MQFAAKTIDVVIPVYNAPELTKRCIDSVVTYLGESIQRVLVQDDASGRETREMLDHLSYACVAVCHSEKNQGFGLTVNAAVSRSSAYYVLILNSDTEVNRNILPQLCAAFDADAKLAAIIPQAIAMTISTSAATCCVGKIIFRPLSPRACDPDPP